MAKATTDQVDALHSLIATTLKAEIESSSKSEDKKGLAALMNVARQFLKDNNVTAMAVPNSPLANLAEGLPFVGDEFQPPEDGSPLH